MPSAKPLLDLLDHKVVPWAERDGLRRFVIAGSAHRKPRLPDDVQVSRKKLRGRRVALKGPRLHRNTSLTIARWPEDGLTEVNSAKLMCVTGGQVDFQIGEQVVHVVEGHFILCPPGTPHVDGASRPYVEGARRENGSYDVLWFGARGQGVQCWVARRQEAGPHQPGENVFILNEQTSHLLSALSQEATSGSENCEKICESYLRALLLLVQREIKAGHFLPINAATEESPALHSPDPISQSQQYIRSHLSEALTLDKVARTVYMSRAQFARRFHLQTGQTFTEFMTTCRLERACDFLRDTAWSVASISKFVGFKSTPYFQQLFRRRMGVSPGAFRREHLQHMAEPRKKQRKVETIPQLNGR